MYGDLEQSCTEQAGEEHNSVRSFGLWVRSEGGDGSSHASPYRDVDLEAAQPTATVICMICFESTAPEEKVPFYPSSNCYHAFCRSCVSQYIASHIADGLTLHRCPKFGEEGCALVYRYDV
jgi:hypothetical protein